MNTNRHLSLMLMLCLSTTALPARKTQTAALPWICVRDDQGASQSYLLQVQRLPADYIISRDNSVVMGPAQIKYLDADIARYL